MNAAPSLAPPHAQAAALTATDSRLGIAPAAQGAIFLVTLLLLFSRLPGALLHPQFFAEDGWMWYQQAYNLGWLRSLTMAHEGHLQTLPRLVAGLSLLFPLVWAPLVMNLAGAVVQALPVNALLSARCAPWGPLPLRAMMAWLYVAIPNAPEVHIVVTDAMWHLAVLTALLAFSLPPVSFRGQIGDCLLFALASVTGPFVLLLLPAIGFWWWCRRERWTLTVIGLLLPGALVQMLTLARSPRAAGAPLGVDAVRLLRILAGNIFINSMTGGGGSFLPVAILLPAAAAGLLLLFWAWRVIPLASRLFMVFAVLVLAASLRDPLLLGGRAPRWQVLAGAPGIRYWFLPSLMLLWCGAGCAFLARSWAMRLAGVAVLLLSTVGLVHRWSYPAWPPGHLRADAARFQALPQGAHMLFAVHDPGGRAMELVETITMATAANRTTRRRFGPPPPRTRWWWFGTTRQSLPAELGVLALGSSGALSVSLVGSLPVNELLLIPILPLALLKHGSRAFRLQYLWFHLLTAGWLLGTLMADAYFASPMDSRLKGTARVVFFWLNFVALAIFVNNRPRRLVMFAISMAVVMFAGGIGNLGDFALAWKFGLSGVVAIFALLLSSHFYRQRRFAVSIAISVFLGALNLYYGFRSQLVVHLVAGMLILPFFQGVEVLRSGIRQRSGAFRVIVLLALAGGATWTANFAIRYAAKLGIFDESTSQKFEGQAKGDYGVLFGGRPETLVAIQAIIDNPILGHGSYPVDQKYLELKQDLQYEHGYSDSDEPDEQQSPVIPTHSHLTMAWVESGILGGICWIYILLLTFRAILHLGTLRPALTPVYSYLLVWFMWDILYSPFGSVNRVWAAYFVLLSYHILERKEGVVRSHDLKRMYQRKQVFVPRRAM